MSQTEENKQFEELLENTNFDYLKYTYSPMEQQQGFLKEMFNIVSTPAADAMGTLGMAPQDVVWGIAYGIELVPGVLSFSTPPNRSDHGLTNPHRTAFHGTATSPLLPETHSTYYSLLFELLLPARGCNSHVCEGCE